MIWWLLLTYLAGVLTPFAFMVLIDLMVPRSSLFYPRDWSEP